MSTFWQLGGVELWQLAGWTMLHFAWIGGVIGAIAFVCWLVTRRAPANVRYVVALGFLCMLAGTPGGVAAWLVVHGFANSVRDDAQIETRNGEVATNQAAPADMLPRIANDTAHERPEVSPSEKPAGIPPHPTLPAIPMTAMSGHLSQQQLAAALEPCAQFLPWMWLIGAPLTFVLLTTGVVGAERLRRASRIIADGPIVEACDRLMQAMHVTRRVAVAVCERVAAPVLVGIVRPIILIPPAALTCWSVDEIEMVLLHELAHVRRWDNLVNLVQRIVESLLFFHPAVWLVSGWVRREREACCDAVVVGRTARPHAYAELLVALAAQLPRSVLFHPAASSAMAAGPLHARIRRILQLEDDPMLVSGKSFALLVGSAVAAATLAVLYLPANGQAKESAPTGVNEIVAEGAEITVAKDESHAALNSDAPTGNARLEIRSQDGKTIVADLKDGRLHLNADPKPAAGKTLDNAAQSSKHKFPSLEEQKLADAAWKSLGLELEPLDEGFLKQVRALGYDGGVHVATVRVFAEDSVHPGDILVGLHVWPTTNLNEVAEVLNRDDIAELSPLKFYVVRPGHPSSGAFSSGPEQDTVVTGRISAIYDKLPTAQVEHSPREIIESNVEQALNSDPNMSLPREELISLAGELGRQQAFAKDGNSEEILHLQKRIAEIQKQIGDYRQQKIRAMLQGQPTGTPAQPGPAVPMPIMPAPANPSAPIPMARAPENPLAPPAPIKVAAPPAPAAPAAPEAPIAIAIHPAIGMPQAPTTHLSTAAGDVRVGGKLLAEEVAADPEIAELRQKLMAAEMELRLKSTDVAGADPASVEDFQKRIAELQQSMGQEVAKKLSGLITDQMSGLDEAARRAAAEMAAAQVAFDRAAKQHAELATDDKAPGGGSDKAAAPQALESFKRLSVARRTLEERKRMVEEINRQIDGLRREREKAAAQQADAKQEAEQNQREAADVAREADAERRQAESEAKQEAEEARREMEEAKREAEDERRQADAERREAEKEARREQEEARREADEAKRDAEDASRQADQEKRRAEQNAPQVRPERVELPDHPVRVPAEANQLITTDGKQQVTVIYQPRPSTSVDGRPDAGHQMLDQIHRQLEEMDRQLEATKRQLQVLAEQKEVLVAHAEKLAKEIEQQSADKQKP